MRIKGFLVFMAIVCMAGLETNSSYAQSCVPEKGVNLVDVKREDGRKFHGGFGDGYSHEEVNKTLLSLRGEGVSYVRVFLDEKSMFGFLNKKLPDVVSSQYFSNLIDFVGLADNLGIKIILVPGYWIPERIKNEKISSGAWPSLDYGENAVLLNKNYASLWGDYVGFVLQAIKYGRSGKLGVYAVDVRNESVFNLSDPRASRFDLNPKFYENFVNSTNLIVSKIRSADEKVKVTMSTYCPSLAGRSSYYSKSISDSVYSPVPLSLLAKTNIDIVDLHVYPGGWAGKSVDEHFKGCNVEPGVIGSKALIVGEIGYSRRFFKNTEEISSSLRDLRDRLQSVRCPDALVVWEKELRVGSGTGGFWSPEVVLDRYLR